MLDRRGRLEVVSAADPGVLERCGLTSHDAASAAWCLTPVAHRCQTPGATGEVRESGARGIAVALAVAWGTSMPLWPWKVPGIGRLLDVIYDLVARNRHRMP